MKKQGESEEPRHRVRAGRVLRKARLRAQRTLREVADAVGLTVAYVSDVERGKRSVSAARLRALADAVDLDTDGRRALFAAAKCLPPSVHQRILRAPEVWDYDLPKVVALLKRLESGPVTPEALDVRSEVQAIKVRW